MTSPPLHTDLENIKPGLSPDAVFVEFPGSITWLQNRVTGELIKLSGDEASLVREFNGSRTLSDILQKQLESSGTARFQRIFELLIELNSRKLLTEDCSGLLKKEQGPGEKAGKQHYPEDARNNQIVPVIGNHRNEHLLLDYRIENQPGIIPGGKAGEHMLGKFKPGIVFE